MDDLATIDRAALWQQAGRALAASMSRSPGLITRAAAGAWRVTSEVDTWMANWLVCFGADAASLAVFAAGLDDAVASGRALSIAVSERVRDQASPLLAERPVLSEGADAMMWRDVRPLPQNSRSYRGQVRQVHAGADLTAVLDLIARAFRVDQVGTRLAMAGALDDPTMKLFTASSETLDSVCMTWSEASVTYIYLMATDPDRQRRGAGWAVMAGAMDAAMRDGATSFFLEASSAGEGLYRQIGFETFELADFWSMNLPPGE